MSQAEKEARDEKIEDTSKTISKVRTLAIFQALGRYDIFGIFLLFLDKYLKLFFVASLPKYLWFFSHFWMSVACDTQLC